MNQQSRTLVINCGSSSLKFALFLSGSTTPTIEGIAEELNSSNASLTHKSSGNKTTIQLANADHAAALQQILEILPAPPTAIGHRIVHGGEAFQQPTRITPEVVQQIASCIPLAPLHNPTGLLGIQTTLALFPDVPQVAVFDTAFHQTLPPRAFHYALPQSLYRDHGVRRYGFHGSSHAFVAQAAAQTLGFPLDHSRIISAHLGNGASATAILNGKSVDTTMGLTPLEGLVMGTRSGDIDPGLYDFLINSVGMTPAEITHMLNKQSGLLGLSGATNDMRRLGALAADGNPDAQLAIEIFCYRLAKSIAALVIATGGVDYLIFTGGIGENDAGVRAKVLELLTPLGFQLDSTRNTAKGQHTSGVITLPDTTPTALVVETNEELMIATLTQQSL